MQANNTIERIVIVGGGAAGWLTASILAASCQRKGKPQQQIVLVESADVPILGVGEGTWPTMRGTLQKIGIDETSFMTACDASFKQGTAFHQWQDAGSNNQYYHPFSLPFNYFDSDCAHWWQASRIELDFAHAVSTQATLCDYQLAPKQADTPPFAGVVNYGYHLDANKFVALLQQHATTRLGVQHIVDYVDSVEGNSDEHISALNLRQYGRLTADFFVDCSGFTARLIGQHYGIPLTSCKHMLANDSAIALPCDYADKQANFASVTRSTAQPEGWIWDIPLPSRRGIGYVYSRQYCSDEQAKVRLASYIQADASLAITDIHSARVIRFEPGYRQTAWQHNCVAIGTAAGFLEPLEASALVMIELAATHLAEQLPQLSQQCAAAARQFNQSFSSKWQRIVDFLKLHYVLSSRNDSDYWRAMQHRDSASSQLQDWLCLWQTRSPNANDFAFRDEIFPAASYLYVLYGMGFRTERMTPGESLADAHKLNASWQKHQHQLRQQLSGLPANRQLLNQLFSPQK